MKTTQKFYKMPQALFSDKFSQLSNDAKILYMLLLNRKSLSEKNDFNDENGNTVVMFSNLEVCRSIGCGHDKATAMFRELEEYQLIRRRKQGKGKPDLIYVSNVGSTEKLEITRKQEKNKVYKRFLCIYNTPKYGISVKNHTFWGR